MPEPIAGDVCPHLVECNSLEQCKARPDPYICFEENPVKDGYVCLQRASEDHPHRFGPDPRRGRESLPSDDNAEPSEVSNPHFWAMVNCITVARRLGETNPDVAMLARALTAVVNGRPAAAEVWLKHLESALDNPKPAPAAPPATGAYTAYSVMGGNRLWAHSAPSRWQTERVAATLVTDHGRERVEIDDPDGNLVYVFTRDEVERERRRWAEAHSDDGKDA